MEKLLLKTHDGSWQKLVQVSVTLTFYSLLITLVIEMLVYEVLLRY